MEHTSRAIRDEDTIEMMCDLMNRIIVGESSDRGTSRNKATKDIFFLCDVSACFLMRSLGPVSKEGREDVIPHHSR